MSDTAIQIISHGPRAVVETAALAIERDSALEAVTYSILEEDEAHDIWRIDAFPTEAAEGLALTDLLAGFSALTTHSETLADADWLAMALSGLPPVRAGRFFVYGVHDRGRTPNHTINLRIEAGAAFGTGHHGTTVGCLLAYHDLLKQRRFPRVLDVGTGTGVLAIAAMRTGSDLAVGTDIDPVSVRIAAENAKVNRVRVSFSHAYGLRDRSVRQAGPYDLVFANILATPLVWLAGDIGDALRPGGLAILSGLLRTQERYVRAAYLSHGFRLERRIHRDAWATLVLRRVRGDSRLEA